MILYFASAFWLQTLNVSILCCLLQKWRPAFFELHIFATLAHETRFCLRHPAVAHKTRFTGPAWVISARHIGTLQWHSKLALQRLGDCSRHTKTLQWHTMRLHFDPDDEVEHVNSKRRATVIYYDMFKSKLYLRMAFDVEQSSYWICGCGVKNWKERKECRSCIGKAGQKQPDTVDEIRRPQMWRVVKCVRTCSPP